MIVLYLNDSIVCLDDWLYLFERDVHIPVGNNY